MPSFEIHLDKNDEPLDGMPINSSYNTLGNVMIPDEIRLVPSGQLDGPQSPQSEQSTTKLKAERGDYNDDSSCSAQEEAEKTTMTAIAGNNATQSTGSVQGSPESTTITAITASNATQNIDAPASRLLGSASADPEASNAPKGLIFGQINSRGEQLISAANNLGTTPRRPGQSSLLTFDNMYIVDGCGDIFHGNWAPVSSFDDPLPAPVLLTDVDMNFHHPEWDSPSSSKHESSTGDASDKSPAATPAEAANTTSPQPVPARRPMFVFSANDSTSSTPSSTPRALAVRTRRRWAGEAAAPASPCPSVTPNSVLPPGTREAIRYRLTSAGASHRELILASTEHDPLPVPSPAGATVDMRDMLDALRLFPRLGIHGVQRDDVENDADDEDDRREEEKVANAAAALVDVAQEDSQVAAAAAALVAVAADKARERRGASTISEGEEAEEGVGQEDDEEDENNNDEDDDCSDSDSDSEDDEDEDDSEDDEDDEDANDYVIE